MLNKGACGRIWRIKRQKKGRRTTLSCARSTLRMRYWLTITCLEGLTKIMRSASWVFVLVLWLAGVAGAQGLVVVIPDAATSYSLTYEAGQHGSLEGELSQVVLPGADGSAVAAVAAEGYSFIEWSDGRTDNPRVDGNVQENVNVSALFADITPPRSHVSVVSNDDGTWAGPTISFPYSAYEVHNGFYAPEWGSGVKEVELYVKVPGSNILAPTGVMVEGDCCERLVYTGADGNGLYEFATRATDNAGNIEEAPTEAQAYALWNLTLNGPFTAEVETSSTMTLFPMEEYLNIIIEIEGAIPGGTITVSRTKGPSDPGEAFEGGLLLDEHLTITGEGLGDAWTATLIWDIGYERVVDWIWPLDTVFQVGEMSRVKQYPAEVRVPQFADKGFRLTSWVIAEGVSGFGDFYAGNRWAYKGNWVGGWVLE